MKIHCLQTGDVQIKSRHQLARYEARPARVVDVLTDKGWSPRLPRLAAGLLNIRKGLS